MSKSPTARTLEHCRKLGWRAEVVEQTIPHTFIKRDLWGFGDVIALDGGSGSLLIQATSDKTGGNSGARVTKIIDTRKDEALDWLDAGNRIEVWAWRQKRMRLKSGKLGKAKRWHLRRTRIRRARGNIEIPLMSEVIDDA